MERLVTNCPGLLYTNTTNWPATDDFEAEESLKLFANFPNLTKLVLWVDANHEGNNSVEKPLQRLLDQDPFFAGASSAC